MDMDAIYGMFDQIRPHGLLSRARDRIIRGLAKAGEISIAAAVVPGFDLPQMYPVPVADLVHCLLACGFDPKEYRKQFRKALSHLTEDETIRHYLVYGYRTGRRIPGLLTFPSGLTDLLGLQPDDRTHLTAIAAALAQSKIMEEGYDSWSLTTLDLARFAKRGLFPYLLIGDSHTYAYRRVIAADGLIYFPLLLLCSGSSAMGLGNPNSKSGSGAKVIKWLRENDAGTAPIFLKFGQVDAEFVYTFQRIRDNKTAYSEEDFAEFSESSLGGYGRFLSDLMQEVIPRRIRVCSIFPPALSDASWADGYVNGHIAELEGITDLDALKASLQKLEMPTRFQRSAAHSLYNKGLRAMCDRIGLTFVDDFTPMLGGDGLLFPKFIERSRGTDHHLEWGPTGAVIPDIIREQFSWMG
jgi:hypothetical protein